MRASWALHGTAVSHSCRAELGVEPWPQLLCCLGDVEALILVLDAVGAGPESLMWGTEEETGHVLD